MRGLYFYILFKKRSREIPLGGVGEDGDDGLALSKLPCELDGGGVDYNGEPNYFHSFSGRIFINLPGDTP